jgi:hypothetical protein
MKAFAVFYITALKNSLPGPVSSQIKMRRGRSRDFLEEIDQEEVVAVEERLQH